MFYLVIDRIGALTDEVRIAAVVREKHPLSALDAERVCRPASAVPLDEQAVGEMRAL
jgi:hypothetical protein